MNKVVLDTCGWLAYFADEPHADRYAPYIERTEGVVVPAIVEFEVQRWALRAVGEAVALDYAVALSRQAALPMDASLARRAAELAHLHKLAASDAIIYAAAEIVDATLITSDPDLQGLPFVEFHPKPGVGGTSRKARRGASRAGHTT